MKSRKRAIDDTATSTPPKRFLLRRSSQWWDSLSVENLHKRDTVTEWLSKLIAHFQLVPDTLNATLSYYDRITTMRAANIRDLQRIAAACLLIAAKREERDEKVPFVRDLCEATDHSVTDDEIRAEEIRILDDLEWQLRFPSVLQMLDLYIDILLNRVHTADDDDIKPPYADPIHFRVSVLLTATDSPYRLRSLTWRVAQAYYTIVVTQDGGKWTRRLARIFGYSEDVLLEKSVSTEVK